MAVDRELWSKTFSSADPPRWPCPNCHVGRLGLFQKSLYTGETAASHDARHHLEWGPEWIVGRFSCMMICSSCGEEIAVAGTYRIDEHFDEDEGQQFINTYTPRFFVDSPPIIYIPPATPSDVAEELTASFQVFWVDPASCANRIRSSVEALLTHKQIARTHVSKGKRKRYSLHHRIEMFKQTYSALGDALMAVKWLGNAGSHSDSIHRDDLLDAYEMMEHVLDELYVQRAKRVAQISRQINRTGKPRSKRR